jgi:hypothetical protein
MKLTTRSGRNGDAGNSQEVRLTGEQIRFVVEGAIEATPALDMHTHLFAPALGSLGLWGIDHLLTYHYLEAELFRSSAITPVQYWNLSTRQRADLIWRTLFVERAPISEATRGVAAVLKAFSLDAGAADLRDAREFFETQSIDSHIDEVFRLAGMDQAVMTNDPLDPAEAPLWNAGLPQDSRFIPVLRLDRILNRWPQHWPLLASEGYGVNEDASGNSTSEVRRFLERWFRRMRPVYMAVSLPDTFQYPEASVRGKLLREAVLPTCREFSVPLSLMIGVRYQANPELRLAGDAVGRADLRSLEHLCAEFPENRFLVSVLSRENQHELCVYARKFRNLMPFGCWWFLNNPSIVEEVTRERLEMLGATFIPQHSDARVLEQVIYKWRNTRRTLAPILANAYGLLAADGGQVTADMIQADVTRLFRSNFEEFARGQVVSNEKTSHA